MKIALKMFFSKITRVKYTSIEKMQTLYKSTINLAVKNNSHTLTYEIIASHLDQEKGRVLEVGCASGYFGSFLKKDGHQVWGVEPNQSAANEASQVLDLVHDGDVDSFFAAYRDEKFDVIVFGDVLEHIVDAEAVLRQCKLHLREGGIIVASIPNVAHLAIRAMLLEGRWDYSDLGILDKTHVKFFTRSSAIDLFSNSGYEVRAISAIKLPPEQVDQICHLNLNPKMLKLAQKAVIDDSDLDFQYVIHATNEQNTEKAIAQNEKLKKQLSLRLVCLVPNPSLSLADIRLRQPLDRWSLRFGGHYRLMSYADWDVEDLLWGDVFLIQRETNFFTSRLVELIHMHEKKIIFEIDDLLCNLPPFLAHHNASFEKTRKYFEKTLVEADGVSVTTPRLAKQLQMKGANTFVVPNCAQTHLQRRALHGAVPSEEVTVVVASSDRIHLDFIISALKEVQSHLGVKILSVGPLGEMLSQAGLVVKAFPTMSYDEFKAFIAEQDNAICLIPLEDSLFSSCKSAIKFLDFSLAGIPVICSNVAPYSDVVENAVTGLLSANKHSDLVNALQTLIQDDSKRRALSEAAREMVQNQYNMEVAAKHWQEMLLNLVPNLQDYRAKAIEFPMSSMDFLRPSLFPFGVSLTLTLFRPSAYEKVWQILKSKGISGVVDKIKAKLLVG